MSIVCRPFHLPFVFEWFSSSSALLDVVSFEDARGGSDRHYIFMFGDNHELSQQIYLNKLRSNAIDSIRYLFRSFAHLFFSSSLPSPSFLRLPSLYNCPLVVMVFSPFVGTEWFLWLSQQQWSGYSLQKKRSIRFLLSLNQFFFIAWEFCPLFFLVRIFFFIFFHCNLTSLFCLICAVKFNFNFFKFDFSTVLN